LIGTSLYTEFHGIVMRSIRNFLSIGETMLTDRQQQVAALVREGLSNKLIARELGVTEGTVKIQLHMIFKKLSVRSRADLLIRFGTSRRVAV
jgi:DNA-binding NarL/FixJ family response regulator